MTDLRALIDTHYHGLNSGDLELAATPFADDVAAEFPTGPMAGIEQFRGMISAFITAFPDMSIQVRNVWIDGDGGVAEIDFTGTHNGPMATADGELPPSGRAIAFPVIDVFVARDGKVTEHRAYWDNASFLTQLGVLGG